MKGKFPTHFSNFHSYLSCGLRSTAATWCCLSVCLTYVLIILQAVTYHTILEFGHGQFNVFEAVLFVSCCFENLCFKVLIAKRH